MKVTGWTYFENPKYIDLQEEHTKIACKLTKNIPKIPDRETFSKMSEEEQEKTLQNRKVAFNAALDNEELHNINVLRTEAYNAVIKELRENCYHFTGNAHQNEDYGTPIIDDKYILCLSQRSWGALMADAFPNEIDNSEGLGYIKWAWTVPEGEEDKIKCPK